MKMKKLENIIKKKILPIVVSSIILSTPINAYCEESAFSKTINKLADKFTEYSKKFIDKTVDTIKQEGYILQDYADGRIDGEEFKKETKRLIFGESQDEKISRLLKAGKQDAVVNIWRDNFNRKKEKLEKRYDMKATLYLNKNRIDKYGSCNPEFRCSHNSQYSEFDYLEIIKKIKTPGEAQKYLDEHICYGIPIKAPISFRGRVKSISKESLDYFKSDFYKDGYLFKEIHENGVGICKDYALAAAALLLDNGYPPQIMRLSKEGKEADHAVYLFQSKEGKYGAIGVGGSPEFRFNTIEELVKDIGYDNYEIDVRGDGSNNLDQFWITGQIKYLE